MDHFVELRKLQPAGPLMNSQFSVGQSSYWGQKEFSTLNVNTFEGDILEMVANGIGFNLHMFHGGTNFGLTSGTSIDGRHCLTSYDFDAPIAEAGDLTHKYDRIKSMISATLKGTESSDEQNEDLLAEYWFLPMLKEQYGEVLLKPAESILNAELTCCEKACWSLFPKSMEELRVKEGFLAYSTVLKSDVAEGGILKGKVHDRAYVIIENTKSIGMIENNEQLVIPNSLKRGTKLTFLVENFGRKAYKPGVNLFKGLFNMYLNNEYLSGWSITSYSIDGSRNVRKLQNLLYKKVKDKFKEANTSTRDIRSNSDKKETISPPAFYMGTFIVPEIQIKSEAFESGGNTFSYNMKKGDVQGNDDFLNAEEFSKRIAQVSIQIEGEKNKYSASYGTGATFDDYNFSDKPMPRDSFLNVGGWGKGVAFVNSQCLGRYSAHGPQTTLYVPGSCLFANEKKNRVTLLELEKVHPRLTVRFVDTPNSLLPAESETLGLESNIINDKAEGLLSASEDEFEFEKDDELTEGTISETEFD